MKPSAVARHVRDLERENERLDEELTEVTAERDELAKDLTMLAYRALHREEADS